MAVQELAKTYNFAVFIENTRIPFSRVSGIETVMDTETVTEGGVNDKERETKKKGKSQNSLNLERALPLIKTENQKLTVGQSIKGEVSVYLMNEYGIFYKAFHFRGCTIARIGLSELDASQSNVLMQKVEIKFQSMEEEEL